VRSDGQDPADFLGADVGGAAEEIVKAFANAQEKAVKDRISKHKQEFEAKSAEVRQQLQQRAENLATMLVPGTQRQTCPACGSVGLVRGRLIKELEPIYEAGELLVDGEYLAGEFRCPACGLHLTSIDEVGLAQVNLRFTQRTATNLHERFQPEMEAEYENI
jgi:predicted RNA-binding Zn-ribbon protein involved in translation (DUF1610 family)